MVVGGENKQTNLHVGEGVARPAVNALNLLGEGGVSVAVVVAPLFHVLLVAVLADLQTDTPSSSMLARSD